MTKKDLFKLYGYTCSEIVKKFCKKQSLSFEYWVADMIGDVACCGDMYFTINDIILDLKHNSPKGDIIKWYDDNLQYPKNAINYYSYIKGLRISDIIKSLN